MDSIDLKNVSLKDINPENLVDIRSFEVNPELTKNDRIKEFVKQIKNPYLFKCGKIIVQISFADTNITLDERMETYLKSL
jgi:hypothetical protein